MGGNSSGMGKRTGGVRRISSRMTVDEPGDAKLAERLRGIFSNPAYATDGNDDLFAMYMKATGYGENDVLDYTGEVGGVRINREVPSVNGPPDVVDTAVGRNGLLRAYFPKEDVERADDLIKNAARQRLEENRGPVTTRYGAVARLYHDPINGGEPIYEGGVSVSAWIGSHRVIRTPYRDRDGNTTYKYRRLRTRLITEAEAAKLLHDFEAKHGPLTNGMSLKTRTGAMSALAAAKGFDVIRADHPARKYEYRVLNPGVLHLGDAVHGNEPGRPLLKYLSVTGAEPYRWVQGNGARDDTLGESW